MPLSPADNWQEAERAEWRAIKLTPPAIKALQYFDANPGTPLLMGAGPSSVITNRLIAKKMLYPQRRVGPGPVRYGMSAYGTLWLIHNKEKLK